MPCASAMDVEPSQQPRSTIAPALPKYRAALSLKNAISSDETIPGMAFGTPSPGTFAIVGPVEPIIRFTADLSDGNFRIDVSFQPTCGPPDSSTTLLPTFSRFRASL